MYQRSRIVGCIEIRDAGWLAGKQAGERCSKAGQIIRIDPSG